MADHDQPPGLLDPTRVLAAFLESIRLEPYRVQLQKLREFSDKTARTQEHLESALEGLEAIVQVQDDILGAAETKPPAPAPEQPRAATPRAYLAPRPGKGELSVREKAILILAKEGPKTTREIADILFGSEAKTEHVNLVRSSLFPSKKRKLLLIKKKRYDFSNDVAREDLVRRIDLPRAGAAQGGPQ